MLPLNPVPNLRFGKVAQFSIPSAMSEKAALEMDPERTMSLVTHDKRAQESCDAHVRAIRTRKLPLFDIVREESIPDKIVANNCHGAAVPRERRFKCLPLFKFLTFPNHRALPPDGRTMAFR